MLRRFYQIMHMYMQWQYIDDSNSTFINFVCNSTHENDAQQVDAELTAAELGNRNQ